MREAAAVNRPDHSATGYEEEMVRMSVAALI